MNQQNIWMLIMQIYLFFKIGVPRNNFFVCRGGGGVWGVILIIVRCLSFPRVSVFSAIILLAQVISSLQSQSSYILTPKPYIFLFLVLMNMKWYIGHTCRPLGWSWSPSIFLYCIYSCFFCNGHNMVCRSLEPRWFWPLLNGKCRYMYIENG